VKKTTGSAKKPKLPESPNDWSPSRATHWCTRLESCDTVHRQFVEAQAKAEATRGWEEGGATFLRFSDASELNQHTASCCNFPSMHASRQRGPIP
jgi:hypothetical protein